MMPRCFALLAIAAPLCLAACAPPAPKDPSPFYLAPAQARDAPANPEPNIGPHQGKGGFGMPGSGGEAPGSGGSMSFGAGGG